jgi:SSS family solute:Na+ symporter
MHYALRPWPWILVALCSTLVYPTLGDIARTFPYVDPKLIGNDMAYPAMLQFLPTPFLGFVIAGVLAAYRSTIETHLNWGTSYLVHDFYRRFLNPGATEKHYVLAGRITTALLMVAAAFLTFALDTAKEAFDLILSIGAGTGLIYLLRWFWWRVSAWSEIAAMTSSFVVALGFFVAAKQGHAVPSHIALIVTVACTTVVWVTVTFLAPQPDRDTLVRFYRLVRPAGPGWRPIKAVAGPVGSPDSLPMALLGWMLGCVFVYAALFGVGSLLYGRTAQALVWLALFAASGVGLIKVVPSMWSRNTAA